ncbi:MAG: hypothetical protein ACRD1D_17550, partial [Acidimicrobiales bacterium]
MSVTTAPTTAPEPALAEATLRAALSNRARPTRATPVAASLTFGWRAALKIKHVPMQLFDVTAFPIMFVLLFTYLFGGALAGSPREYLQDLHLDRIHAALDRVDAAGPEDDLYELLKDLEDVVKEVRTGGVVG